MDIAEKAKVCKYIGLEILHSVTNLLKQIWNKMDMAIGEISKMRKHIGLLVLQSPINLLKQIRHKIGHGH